MKSTSATKQTRLNVRASRQQKAAIVRAAKLVNMTVSGFLLQRAYADAQEILAEQTRFQLSDRQWKAFCAALDAPPRELPALRELLTKPGVFDE